MFPGKKSTLYKWPKDDKKLRWDGLSWRKSICNSAFIHTTSETSIWWVWHSIIPPHPTGKTLPCGWWPQTIPLWPLSSDTVKGQHSTGMLTEVHLDWAQTCSTRFDTTCSSNSLSSYISILWPLRSSQMQKSFCFPKSLSLLPYPKAFRPLPLQHFLSHCADISLTNMNWL